MKKLISVLIAMIVTASIWGLEEDTYLLFDTPINVIRYHFLEDKVIIDDFIDPSDSEIITVRDHELILDNETIGKLEENTSEIILNYSAGNILYFDKEKKIVSRIEFQDGTRYEYFTDNGEITASCIYKNKKILENTWDEFSLEKKIYYDNYLIESIYFPFHTTIFRNDYSINVKVFDKNHNCRFEKLMGNDFIHTTISDKKIISFIEKLNLLLKNKDIYGLIGILDFNGENESEKIQRYIDHLLYNYFNAIEHDYKIRDMFKNSSKAKYSSILEIENIDYISDLNEYYLSLVPSYDISIPYYDEKRYSTDLVTINTKGDEFDIFIIEKDDDFKLSIRTSLY